MSEEANCGAAIDRAAGGLPFSGSSVGSQVIAVIYLVAACAMCLYGLHRLWLSWRLLRDRRARLSPAPSGRFMELPAVTVQLPMFNERNVAERVIDAVCAMDYPRDRLHIQVLDDSNDESAVIVRACCERMALAGHSISCLQRPSREGYKSGALAAGLKATSSELIAIFDADFLPGPDFLRQTVDHFTDSQVGMVQAEWSHLNRSQSWLTELQAIFLDGHFVVEQAVRSVSHRWFNFNGTAGVWRRSCIEDAGGWQHDTLTEDTDLSYRAQLQGWKFLYLPTVRCRAELPSTMTSFLGQQHRWTKGLIQTARKLLPRIMRSNARSRIKAEAWFHLTSPFLYLLMFLVSAIALPAILLATPSTAHPAIALAGLAAMLVGTSGAATFYLVSQRVQGRSLWTTLLRIPSLMALGIGICAVNAGAVAEAIAGAGSPFVRTPKFGGRRDCDPDPVMARRGLRLPRGLLELLMASVLFTCVVISSRQPWTWMSAPVVLLCALGYSGVGVLRMLEPFSSRVLRATWLQRSLSGFAASVVGAAVLAAGALGTMLLAPSVVRQAVHAPEARRQRREVPIGLDLMQAGWRIMEMDRAGIPSTGAIRSLRAEHGSWVVGVELDERSSEGELILDVETALRARGRSPRSLFQGEEFGLPSFVADPELVFEVEVPARFTGELQAFVKDGEGRSEYGSMGVVDGTDAPASVTVTLSPTTRTPAMGYQDKGFDPLAGINEIGIKISAQSDRVRGAGYRPFSGIIRLVRVGIAGVPPAPEPAPEIRTPDGEPRAVATLTSAQFLRGSGVDRPWPFGYGFAGPVTPAITEELERTYGAMAARGLRFTRVYAGDYRTGLVLDGTGKVSGVESGLLDYLDDVATVANRHGITVMFSLTDNAMLNHRPGDRLNDRQDERLALVREGEASDAFVDHGLVEIIKKLKGRSVIWDLFNEPENVTSLSLRELQRYVDRAIAAGRRADPQARFTVVSRSRPELAYWRGRGLSLYSHNVFSRRALEESLAEPQTLGAPLLVAEMAPELASRTTVEALRGAGYGGVGIWGWGTLDRYQWPESDLERITEALRGAPDDEDSGRPPQATVQ